LATGRLLADTLPYAQRLGITAPLILHHGALLVTADRVVLVHQPIPGKAAQGLVAIARELNLSCQAYAGGELVVEKITPWTRIYLGYSKVKPVVVPDLAAYVAGGISQFDFLGEPEELAAAHAQVAERLAGAVRTTSSHPNLLEVLASGVSKGRALARLAEHLGIPLAATVAVGDGFNDLEMLQAAGLGVAMANAPAAVRAQADYVTAGNNENGVARLITKLLAGKL
ncbi:MAG TPA: HAD family phosphatase, partial [Firmicutes bacterium]|nr:HAD family phosphatase [Bacillota bacterium]